MVSRREVKELFNLAEAEAREEQLREKAIYKEQIEAERKALMLEYVVEHLPPDAFIAVHQTNHFPRGGKLKPTGHFLLDLFKAENPKRIIQDLQLKSHRITIHFTLNYPVVGVAAGGEWFTWEGKYAVLIPVKDFMDRIVCLNPVDTWIIGELKLPSSAEILINEEEYYVNPDNWKALAGNAKVVPFPRGEKIHEAIKKRIRIRGYHVTDGGDHGWYEGDRLEDVAKFIRASKFLSFEEKDRLIAMAIKKGYHNWNQIFFALADKFKKITTPHWKTLWRDIEVLSSHIYGIIFEPSYDEREASASTIKHKLEALAGEANQYKEKLEGFILEDKFASQEEKASLGLLIKELKKTREWIIELLQKIENLPKNFTWEEFLKQEKII